MATAEKITSGGLVRTGGGALATRSATLVARGLKDFIARVERWTRWTRGEAFERRKRFESGGVCGGIGVRDLGGGAQFPSPCDGLRYATQFLRRTGAGGAGRNSGASEAFAGGVCVVAER